MDYAKFVCLIVLSVALKLYYINLIQLCELDKCPFCYGQTYCTEFPKLSLRYDSFRHITYNFISSKNVYFARNGNNNVVIKQLQDFRHPELQDNHQLSDVKDILLKSQSFYVCDAATADLFLDRVGEKNLTNLWTILRVNVEPLILEVFSKEMSFAVPQMYGYCGMTFVVEDCGTDLNSLEEYSWETRAFIAVQIMKAVSYFTNGHVDFRLYMTDISPDNIMVDIETMKVAFVDLDHVILQRKRVDETYHYSEHFDDNEYSFSTKDVCESDLSDHNIYAVCRLLLSQNSPWPMMYGGLLHAPPISLEIPLLFDQIEQCVSSPTKKSRFDLFNAIEHQLEQILIKNPR